MYKYFKSEVAHQLFVKLRKLKFSSTTNMAKPVSIELYNPNGKYRVVSTKPMPGTRWINLLVEQDVRLEVIFFFIV